MEPHNSALLAKEKLTIRNSPCYLKEKRTQVNGVRLHDDVNFQQLLKRTKIQIDPSDSCFQVPVHEMQQSYENKACIPHSEECKAGNASSLLEVAPYHILCHKKSKMNKCHLGKIHKTEYALLFQHTRSKKKCVENSEPLKTQTKLQDHNYESLYFKTVNTKSTTLTYTCEDNSIICKSFSNSHPLASNYVPLANGNAMNKSQQRACSSDSSKLNAHQVTVYPHIQTNNKESIVLHYSSGIISIKPGQEVNNQSNNNLENLETGNPPIQDKVSNKLYHNCSTYNTYCSLKTFPIDQYLVDVADLPQFTNISTDTDDDYADMLKITASIPPNVLDYDWYPATSVTTQARATKATEKTAFRTSIPNHPVIGNAETLSVLPGAENFAFSHNMSHQQTKKLVVRMSGQANASVDLNEPITHLGALVGAFNAYSNLKLV